MQSVGPNKKQKVFEEKKTSRSEIDEVIWRRDRKGIRGKEKKAKRRTSKEITKNLRNPSNKDLQLSSSLFVLDIDVSCRSNLGVLS